MIDYGDEALRRMIEDVERAYPAEGCGLVFEEGGAVRAVPVENVLDRYHAKDPERFPRGSRTGYLLDPRRQLEAIEAAEARGGRLAAVFHSHADVGAYFSQEDQAQALSADGAPLLPAVEYLVLSVRVGRCDAIKAFAWDGRAFREREVALPGR